MDLRSIITKVALFFCLVLPSFNLSAHPSWGIVVNTTGEIYFSDVLHGGEGTIWKLDKKGRLSPVLQEYHAHPLHIDQNDVLWASANRYITGLIEGDGEHVLTKIYPNGKKEEVIRTRTIKDFAGGNTTVTANGEPVFEYQKKLYKRTKNGQVKLLVDHTFDRLVTLYTAKDGSIYATDNRHQGGSIYRITNKGKLELYVTHLLEEKPENPPYSEPSHNLLFGMTQTPDGQLYVANSGSRRILRIDQKQQTHVFHRSTAPWFPVGITFYEGTAYIMEVGYQSGKGHLGPRILKVEKGKSPAVIADTDTPDKDFLKGSIAPNRDLSFPWNRNVLVLLAIVALVNVIWRGRRFFLLVPLLFFFSCNPEADAQEIPAFNDADQKLLAQYESLAAPYTLTLTKADEPGEPLLLIGQVLDRKTGEPVANCRAFFYHTTAEGGYEQKDPDDPTTSKINGELVTDKEGRFLIKTILPADYPGKKNNRHIHTTFYHGTGFNLNIFFEPYATNGIRKWAKKSGHGVIVTLKKQAEGYFAFAELKVPYRP